MKGKRFTEEQIIGVLKEAEAGAKSKELCLSSTTRNGRTVRSATIRRRSSPPTGPTGTKSAHS